MLDIYKGIKIEDKVIIVEKQNSEHQGYLVNSSTKGQLDSALNWAETRVYDETLREKYNEVRKTDSSKADQIWKEYIDSGKKVEGVVHNYDNGKFRLKLKESAYGSSQGGKLSFWNCTIVAPDGKEFLIGINSECLLQLLTHTTFIKGECQSNLWLGRIKSNVGAFTEEMDEYKQGLKDKATRELKKTSKYNVGDIVSSLNSSYLYLGEIYQRIFIYRQSHWYRGGWDSPEYIFYVPNKPVKKYAYDYIYRDGELSKDSYNRENFFKLHLYDTYANKKSGIIEKGNFYVDIKDYYNDTAKMYHNMEESNYEHCDGYSKSNRDYVSLYKPNQEKFFRLMLSLTGEPITDEEIMDLFNRASVKIVHNKEEIPNHYEEQNN